MSVSTHAQDRKDWPGVAVESQGMKAMETGDCGAPGEQIEWNRSGDGGALRERHPIKRQGKEKTALLQVVMVYSSIGCSCA